MSSWLRGYTQDWKYSTCLFSSNSLRGESKVGVGTLVRDAFEQSGRSVGVHPLPAEVDEVNEGGEIFNLVGQQVSRGVRGGQDVSCVVRSLADGGTRS